MVQGPTWEVDASLVNPTENAYVQCSGPLGDNNYARPKLGYTKQIGGYCQLHCEDPDNYRNVFFTRQFLGFGLDRKGSATSCDFINLAGGPANCTVIPVAVCCKPKKTKYYSYKEEDEYSSNDEDEYRDEEEEYKSDEDSYKEETDSYEKDSPYSPEEEEEEYYPPSRSSGGKKHSNKAYDDGGNDADKPYDRYKYGSSGGKYKKAYRDASDSADSDYLMTSAKRHKETPEALAAPVKSGHKKAAKPTKADFPWLGPLMN